MVEVLLKVAEAEHRDIGRFIVRIDAMSMEKLGVRTGDIIQINDTVNFCDFIFFNQNVLKV